MTRSRTALLAATGLAGALVLGVQPGASAESVTRADPAGDVEVLVLGNGPDEEETVTDPDETLSDIVSTTVDHRRQFLVVTSRLRDQAGGIGRMTVQVKAGGERYGLVGVRGDEVNVEKVGPGSRYRPCPGGVSGKNGQKDVLRIKVPVRCIDSPDEARVRVFVQRSTSTPQEFRAYFDDAAVEGRGPGSRFFGPLARG